MKMQIKNKEYDLTKIIFSMIILGSLALSIVTLAIFSERGSEPWMAPTGMFGLVIAIGVGFFWTLMRKRERKKYS